MRAIIVGAGQSDGHKGRPAWLRADDWILGADGGAAQVRAWGLTPDLVVGDLDSLPAKDQAALEDAGIAFMVHPRAKDETDLELALTEAAERGFEEIVVVQALGGRLDHTLANMLLLALPALAGRQVRIVDGGQEATLVRPGEALVLEGQRGDLVSLLPLGGDAHGVTVKGLAWPLEEATLRFGFSRGVSNEMLEARAQVSIEDGTLLVVHGPAAEKHE